LRSRYGIRGSFGYTRTLIRNGNISNSGAGSVIQTIERASGASWKEGCDSGAWMFDNPSVYARRNFFGVVAFSAFLLLGLTAFSHFRRRRYHLWYCVHVVCTVAALTALINHHGSGYMDVAVPYLVLIFADYLLRLVRVYQRQPIVAETSIVRDADGRAALCSLRLQLKADSTGTAVEAGQYFFLCCPAISRSSWHPYSAASLETSAAELAGANAASAAVGDSVQLEFLIAADGPWSRKLINRSECMVGQRVWCDGPFGRLSISPARYSHVIIVCGGIGAFVSPFRLHRTIQLASSCRGKCSAAEYCMYHAFGDISIKIAPGFGDILIDYPQANSMLLAGATPFFRVIDELLAVPNERYAR
jgi:hypothetical protein